MNNSIHSVSSSVCFASSMIAAGIAATSGREGSGEFVVLAGVAFGIVFGMVQLRLLLGRENPLRLLKELFAGSDPDQT